jgi:hypothetical protein
MATWLPQNWQPSLDAPTRSSRQGGSYQAYSPDPLLDRPIALGAEISARAAEVEASVRRLTLSPESRSLEGLARFLLRSEATRARQSPSPVSTNCTTPCSPTSGTTGCARYRTGSAGTTGTRWVPSSSRRRLITYRA